MEGTGDGNHWEGLKALLPAYRCITRVHVGDGATTAFWWDFWMGDTSLASKFPCLLSHCTQPDATVGEVCSRGISTMLVPRLSPQATKEMHEVEALIAATPLHHRPNARSNKFIGPANKLCIGHQHILGRIAG
jgi:hypothetical protein